MFNNTVRRRWFLLIALFSLILQANAQLRIVSPYSRFGIGDLADNNNSWNMSMGQLGIGIQNHLHVNYANPASAMAFDSLSFVFEGGLNSEFVTLRSDFQKVSRNQASLGYLLFGMPVNRWWKTSVGLVPFSDVGYNVANYENYPNAGTIIRLYSGSGGISRIFWGNAFRPMKGLSLGINASYLFGSMERSASVIFPDSLNAMNLDSYYYVTMSDLWFNFGAQYTTRIGKDISLTLGAVFSPTLNMAARADVLATTYLLSSTGVQSPRDTLLNEERNRGNIVLPMMTGGGFSLEKKNKWMVGLDGKWQNWEKFTAFEYSDSLVNSWQLSAGGQFIPDIDNYTSYLSRVHYRIGFNFHQTYLRIKGEQLNEFAISFGLGLPLRGTKTMLNLGFQYGNRGTTAQNLIREDFFKVVVGFSIYERWFIKRKYF